MSDINTLKDLRMHIQQLEIRQSVELSLLKTEINLTYEKFKPINLIKSGFKEITSSPDFKDNMIGTAVGLATGFISKVAMVGTSHNPVKKLLGSVLQLLVTNSVANHPETVKSVLGTISGFLGKLKKDKPETES